MFLSRARANISTDSGSIRAREGLGPNRGDDMLKRLRILAVIVGVTALAVPTSSHARTTEYKYVAGDLAGWTSFWDIVDGVLANTPVGHVAPFGWIQVDPSSTRFTITVDDLGARDGLDVPVYITTTGKTLFRGCIPVRSTRTIKGASVRDPVWILIGSSAQGCSGVATAGIANVTS